MSASFIVNLAVLAKILEQIKIAARHAAGENLVDIIGQDNALLPLGLRTADSSINHLLPGQGQVGAADELFPGLPTAGYINEAVGPSGRGNDTIVLPGGFGNDTVTAFDADGTGGQDLIDISGLGIAASDFASRVTVTDVGNDMLVTHRS